MQELIDSIGNNVKQLIYDPEKEKWLIVYKTNLSPDEIDSDNLIDFLMNA